MGKMKCESCETIFESDQSDNLITCPNCGSEVKNHYMQAGRDEFEISFSIGFSAEIIRSVHMRYYQLANEMASKSLNSLFRADIVTYCLGTVMLSYSAIDSFIHNQTIVNKALKRVMDSLSSDEEKKFYRGSLIDRIERLYNETHNADFKRGIEPIQSLNYLTDLRIHAVHYKPFPESHDKDWKKEIKDIVHNPNRKFELAKGEDDFLNLVYSADCAKWSFLFIEEMLNWFCDNFDIKRQTFNPRDDIG